MTADLLVYYFPQYHADPRNDAFHPRGWTEWEILASSVPHFPGHQWPRWPLESGDSDDLYAVAARAVEHAATAGITGFVVDWYWYQGQPFLQDFLDQGLLPALEGTDFRFALMWANHPWMALYPAIEGQPVQWFASPNDRQSVTDAMTHVAQSYLQHPNYWRVNECPYFSIYDVPSLVDAQGGVDQVSQTLTSVRDSIRQIISSDIHLNLVSSRFWDDRLAVLKALGADSTTHYTWWHHDDHGFTKFPGTPYDELVDLAIAEWKCHAGKEVEYIPNVTVGWDPSPRTVPWAHDRDRGYPYTGMALDRSPAHFERALRAALRLAEEENSTAVLINAWNEWTEDSYLEPDDLFGRDYLDSIARVHARRA